MPKRKGFYSTTPAVPDKKIAGMNPVGSVELGSAKPPSTPEKEGVSHGLGPQLHQFGHPHVKGVHGYGHLPKQKHGHYRTSGNPLAHQIGKRHVGGPRGH